MGSVNHAAPCLSSVAIDLHDYKMPPIWRFPQDHQGLGQTVGGNFRFIGEKILGFRWNWILEMGGISVVLGAS
jgi:hypothetical protein